MKSIRKRMNLGPDQLRNYLQKIAIFNTPIKGTKSHLIEINGVSCEQFEHGIAKDDALLYFIHGGAFSLGSPKTHSSAISHLCKLTALKCVAVDYSLSPQYKYPTQLDECERVYEELIKTHPDKKIIILGDSAGGNLTVALALRIREKGIKQASALVLMSPWLDLRDNSEAALRNFERDSVFNKDDLFDYASMYCDNEQKGSPYISPLTADLENLPPTLIQVAKNELLFSDSKNFAQKAVSVGVDLEIQVEENLFHSWQLFPSYLKEAEDSLKKIARFIQERR